MSDIRYNRFSDEADGTASYEINVPNAGTTMIVGNLIEQGPMTMNGAIIDYGSEPSGFNALPLTFPAGRLRAAGPPPILDSPGRRIQLPSFASEIVRAIPRPQMPIVECGESFASKRDHSMTPLYDVG